MGHIGAEPGPIESDGLYHLATSEQWARYKWSGQITPDSLATEGLVHCSWGHQVAGTVAKHFPDATDLVALRLDTAHLGDLSLVEEDSHGSGQTFPHIYGPIPAGAVIDSKVLMA